MALMKVLEAGYELRKRLRQLAEREQQATREIVLKLGELEKSSAHILAGYRSLFAYCTIELGYSEPAAMRRIKAARLVRRFPKVGEYLRRGKLNLTTTCILADVIDSKNINELLEDAAGQPKAVVERLAARYKPEVQYKLYDRIKTIFIRKPKETQNELALDSNASEGQKLEQELENYLRYGSLKSSLEEKVMFTFVSSPEFSGKVQRMKQLLSGKYLRGARLEDVFMEAMDCYIKHNCPVEKAKRKMTRQAASKDTPRTTKRSRHIPADIFLQVYLRDNCRCTYVGPDGRRCGSYHGVEVDHIVPYARGGSHDPENLRLLCKKHNLLEAERSFGREHMEKYRGSA